MHRPGLKISGFTLLELMIVVVVIVIVMTVAVPNLREMIKNNRVTGQGNEIVAIINYARNEALRRNDNVPVEFSSAGFSWSAEVVDPDGDGLGDDACEAGVLRCSSYDRVKLEFGEDGDGSQQLVFNNRGYLTPFTDGIQRIAMEHEECTGALQRRILTIRPTGQLESCRVDCGNNWECEGD